MTKKNRLYVKQKIDEGWDSRRALLNERKEKHSGYTKNWKKGLIKSREYLFERLSRYQRLGP